MQKAFWFTLMVVGVLALVVLSTHIDLSPVTASASWSEAAAAESGAQAESVSYPGPRSTPRPWVHIPIVSSHYVPPTPTPNPAYP